MLLSALMFGSSCSVKKLNRQQQLFIRRMASRLFCSLLPLILQQGSEGCWGTHVSSAFRNKPRDGSSVRWRAHSIRIMFTLDSLEAFYRVQPTECTQRKSRQAAGINSPARLLCRHDRCPTVFLFVLIIPRVLPSFFSSL